MSLARVHRRSQVGPGGFGFLQVLADLFILCFEKRRPKQKYCRTSKIKHFGPKNILGWLRHCTRSLLKSACDMTASERSRERKYRVYWPVRHQYREQGLPPALRAAFYRRCNSCTRVTYRQWNEAMVNKKWYIARLQRYRTQVCPRECHQKPLVKVSCLMEQPLAQGCQPEVHVPLGVDCLSEGVHLRLAIGGGTISVVKCPPLNWQVTCSIHGH